ncbi:hypothetical protein K458DRAFT_411352 [Lentithecium fluviatile CBS 122367]|uniref:Uncharacterized protein n=1 Tax=Lentithecium fluviatile CBS 122367 TaxID=1168545 RepID=A0A6G1JM30_9PLEO|nr:hypothetical protein K458DRAFT_411352 [Lentithecium fluviatile CBS 122367]
MISGYSCPQDRLGLMMKGHFATLFFELHCRASLNGVGGGGLLRYLQVLRFHESAYASCAWDDLGWETCGGYMEKYRI